MITMMKKAWAMLPWDFYDQDTTKLHNQVSSCMDTLDSYSKDHGFTSMEVGKKSSSKTLT